MFPKETLINPHTHIQYLYSDNTILFLIEAILSPTPSVTNHKALQTACPTAH